MWLFWGLGSLRHFFLKYLFSLIHLSLKSFLVFLLQFLLPFSIFGCFNFVSIVFLKIFLDSVDFFKKFIGLVLMKGKWLISFDKSI